MIITLESNLQSKLYALSKNFILVSFFSKLMLQGVIDKMINFLHKSGGKGQQIKGKITDGNISQNTCHKKYYLCGKFHSFMKKRTFFLPCYNVLIAPHFEIPIETGYLNMIVLICGVIVAYCMIA